MKRTGPAIRHVRQPCRTFWGSHGCVLARHHSGTCWCGPACPGPNVYVFGEDQPRRTKRARAMMARRAAARCRLGLPRPAGARLERRSRGS